MNHIYRVVWNACKGAWQAVSEFGTGRVRSTTRRARRRQQAVLAALLAASGGTAAWAAGPLPDGGRVVAGQATISTAGTAMTVNQATQKAAIDWSGFSIGQGHTVNFVQPSASSVALNRVLGADPSTIQGALNANGHVFLINPNGVLFSPTAQVNVGGLMATTLAMGTEDFLAGRYQLAGGSTRGVENQGTIRAADGGNVALVAARVSNTGSIEASQGNVLLGAGSQVLVDFGGPVKLQVQRGALDALVENGGAVRADGGTVLMTAKSANELSGSVINNTGVVQARTLATGKQGQILLLGDMQTGTLQAGGTLDASAPAAGNGGAIETSAAHVQTAEGLVVNAGAAAGKGGDWLVDPYDYTINGAAATTITGALNQGTNVTVSTQVSNGTGVTGSGNGDITVSSAIAKTAGGDATLTLRADRNITVNSDITSTSGKLNVTLSSANAASATRGGVTVAGSLKSNGGNILIGGANGSASGGIAYALNTGGTTTGPAVTIGNATPASAPSILSSGGDITINGRSLVGGSSGNYDDSTSGVFIRAGVTIKSGNGYMLINGESDGGTREFGFAFEGGSNTVTTLGASSGGVMMLNGVNATPGGYSAAVLNQGAVGLVAYGSRDQVVFQGPSVAGWLINVNGAPQLSAYTQSPQLASCPASFPNCGTMVIPGSNNSYLYATYQAVDMATHALYVTQTGSGTKTYDGTTATSGLTYSPTTDIAGFSVSNLNPTPAFTTPSKNAGTYTKLVPAANNPVDYVTGGVTYAVGYFNTGSFTITPKTLTPNASSKVYDGNTTAAVSVTGAIAGDSVTASGTGAFGAKDVGTYNVSITGITLGGADAGNYTLSGNAASATASITARTVTLNGSKTYDGSTNFSAVTVGNLVAGEDLVVSGATANSANVATASYINAATLADGVSSLASNYQLPSLGAASAGNAASIARKALSITGLTAADKVYDGGISVQLSGGSLSGLVGAETLNLSTITGAFADKNVGTGKTVGLASVALTDGTGLASNYTFAQPSGLTANITAKALTVSGITAFDKAYDGRTSATVNAANAVLTGLVAGDTVTISATGGFADKDAGAGKTVTLSSTHGGFDAGNYTITDQASTTAAITPKALTVTGMGVTSRTYDGTATAALTGGSLSGLVGNENLVLGTFTGAFADQNAGTGKGVTVNGGTLSDGTGLAANYSLTLPTGLTGTITPKALTVTGVTAQDKVYDGSTSAQLTGGSISGLVGGETLVLGTLAGAFSDKNAGAGKTVTLTGGGISDGTGLASNYSLTSPGNLSANITAKALTVSGITAANKAYDGGTSASVSAGNAVLTGLVAGDAVTTSATGAFADKDAGNGKTVALSSTHGGADVGNYTITDQASTTANITPKALTVTGMTASSKVYDGTTATTVTGGTLSGLVGNETLGIAGGTGAFGDKNVGTGKSVTVTGVSLTSGTGLAANYAVSNPTGVTANITAKALTVSGITAANKAYDGGTSASVNTAGVQLAGLVQGDVVTTSATGSFANANAGNGKAVSLSSTHGGADAGNYTITDQASTTASITPKALTVTGMTAGSKVYDGTTAATLSGGALSGLVGGETLGITGGTGAYVDKNAGTAKSVTVSGIQLANGTGLASNYTVSNPVGVTGDITAKALTVSGITAANKVYDGTTTAVVSAGNAQLAGLVQGDVVTVNATGAFADKNAGSGKAVTLTSTHGGADAANYAITDQASTTASITPKALTVTGMTAADKVYDGSTSAQLSGGTLSGLVAGEQLAIAGGAGTYGDANAGSGKGVTVTGVTLGSGTGQAANYTVTNPTDVKGSITPKALTVTGMTAADKVYDGTTAATLSGGTLAGLVGGETLGIAGGAGTFGDKNVGPAKSVAVTGVVLVSGTGQAGNYTVSNPANVTGNITPKALTVSGITAADKVYDGTTAATVSAGNAVLAGLVRGDAVTVAATGAFADRNAGTGKTVGLSSTHGGLDAGNYAITDQATASANITAKALTVTGMTAADKVYDGTTAAVVSGGTLAGLVGNETLGLTGGTGTFGDKNVGSGKSVSVSGLTLANGTGLAANYTVAAPSGITAGITRKSLTVTGTAIADKTADGTATGTVSAPGTLAGVVASDSVRLDGAGATAQFAQATPGTGIAVSVGGLVLAGTDAGNYALPGSVASTGTIRAATPPAARAAAAAAIAPQGGITSSLVAPAVGGLSYVAVGEQGGTAANSALPLAASTPATASTTSTVSSPAAADGSSDGAAAPVSATQRRQASRQAAGNGRDVKYLDVLVVSGGIRMPDADGAAQQ